MSWEFEVHNLVDVDFEGDEYIIIKDPIELPGYVAYKRLEVRHHELLQLAIF